MTKKRKALIDELRDVAFVTLVKGISSDPRSFNRLSSESEFDEELNGASLGLEDEDLDDLKPSLCFKYENDGVLKVFILEQNRRRIVSNCSSRPSI